jgi:hypothetical protein
MNPEVEAAVVEFAEKIYTMVRADVVREVQATLAGPAVPAPAPRPMISLAPVPSAAKERVRRTCLVEGCENTAAPRFGGVCAALHKGLSKKEIKKLRTAYEAKKRLPAAKVAGTAVKAPTPLPVG